MSASMPLYPAPLHSAQTTESAALQVKVFGVIRVISTIGAVGLLAASVVLAIAFPKFPAWQSGVTMLVFLGVVALSGVLVRQQRPAAAVTLYMAGLAAALFALMYLSGGVTGPLAVVLVSIPVTAQLIGGRYGLRWAAIVGVAYAALALLELAGLATARPMTSLALHSASLVMFTATLIVIALIVRVFLAQSERAFAAERQRERELAQATEQAQQAAQAEQQAREREEQAARQLRQAIQQYTAFLDRVTSGEYEVRLDLAPAAPQDKVGQELAALGQQLNTTVASLVTALANMQTVQQRYAREAWQTFVQSSQSSRGFQFSQEDVEPNDAAWVAPMAQAVQEKTLAASESELALPLTLRGQVIGAIGARRAAQGQSAGWSRDDLALAEAITDQLAQTIDGLRLLDETQRRAARERLLNEITVRIRAATAMDAILDSAVREIGQAMGAGYVSIDLELAPD